MYFVQQWYALADEALEDAIYDSQALRDFVGIDLSVESVPDATTLLKFRHLLEKQALTQVIFEQINDHLAERGMLMREGTIVDATIIAAPPSTKNRAKARDRIVGPPEMHQAKKGNVFGVNYPVRSATTMMAGWVVLLFTLCSLFELLLSSVTFPL